jgi:amino acid transporter
MKFSAHLNNFCTLAGLFLPIALIIGIGIAWFFSDNAIQLHFTKQNFFPDFHNSEMLIALSGMIMSFCGIEIATIHSDEVKNPHRSFPIALSMATLILALFLICGAFSIAIILPPHQMNILAGIMQTFQIFLSTYNLIWAMPAIAILLVLGCIGSVNNWIIAPIKGLSIAASETKHLKHFAKSNQHNAPHVLLIYQAIIVTLLMFVFIALPSVNASYWLLTNLALQLFMLMYILLFAAGIRARFKHPTIQRSFTIPGKNIGMMIIGTLGIIGALLTFAIGFVPPSDIQNGGIFRYEIILLLCLAFTILPPFFIHKKAKEEPENEILKVIETS